jgi:16S rRNA (guanine966-N2)-methyltransferase
VRIIAGAWRGRRFTLPDGTHARPTPDRVRATLFNWLGERIVGARCLDLYAGSGILGLEALSRGAADVQFVEADRKLTAALEARLTNLESRARVATEPVERFLARPAAERFDIVFVDPPYDSKVQPVLASLGAHIDGAALIYLERAAAEGLPDASELEWLKKSRAGAVVYGLARPTRAP